MNRFSNFIDTSVDKAQMLISYEIALTDKTLVCCLKQFVANLGNSFLSVLISVTWFTWWLECQNDYSRHSKAILEIFVVNS